MTKVVQITNIAPQATKDQMQSLFGSIGKVEDLRLYPTIRDVSCPVVSRICYVKFIDQGSVAVAQHMTNTVFIDRALIVIPVHTGVIPDEFKAIDMLNNGTLVPGLQSSGSKLPAECINRIEGSAPNQVISTSDPKLDINELPKYPSLPVNFDARKIEETRRTIIVIDIKPDWTVEELMTYFERAGEVKYGRLAEKDQLRMAMIEFSEQKSVVDALKLQGTEFKGELLDLYHSTEPIMKPQAKSNEAAQKEIEEAMSIVKEAQSMITAAIDPMIGMLAKDKVTATATSRRRSRSRSRERRRSRSRSRKRSKSRKRSRSRTRKRSHSRTRRSRSRSRRSRSKRRSTSRKRSPSRRSRSRTKESRAKRSRSKETRRRKSKSRHRSRSKSHSRRKSRSRSRDRKSRKEEKKRHRRSKSRSKSRKRSRSRTRKEERKTKRRSPDSRKHKEEKIKRDYDDEEKIGLEGSVPRETKRGARTPPSPAKSGDMDISSSP